MSLFSKGHCLLVGVPGLAKTLLVSTVAQHAPTFKRIQFTPDMMPSDITGTDISQDDPKPAVRFTFLRRPRLREHDPRGRDQSDPAKNPGCPARSDARTERHRGRRTHTTARTIFRAGHAKPDRTRRHLSVARSPARSVHVQHQSGVSVAEKRCRCRRPATEPRMASVTACNSTSPSE